MKVQFNLYIHAGNWYNHVMCNLIYRCQDYVRIIRPGSGNSTESCGSTITNQNQNQLEQGTHMHACISGTQVRILYAIQYCA